MKSSASSETMSAARKSFHSFRILPIMKHRFIFATLLSASLAMPVAAASVTVPAPLGVEGSSDVVTVAAKRKKRQKQRHALRNPRNGDILVGPVEGFHHHERRGGRRVREGNDLGGLIGEAVNNYMFNGVPRGRHTRRTGPNEVPDGGYGQNCGVQYWTPNPSSPAC